MRAGFPPGFQQDDRPELRFVTGLHKFRIPDRRFRPVRVYIGIFEQTGPKILSSNLMAERSNRSRADFREFGGPHSVGFQHGTFVVVAAELVYSGFERFVMPLRDAQCLHSPAFAVSLLDAGIVVRDAPIRADDAVVSVSVPQQIGDDIFAKTVADLFPEGSTPWETV